MNMWENLVLHWEQMLAFAVTLLIILDPLGNSPVAQRILQVVPPRRRPYVLLREMVFVVLMLLFFFLLGRHVLGYFGVTTPALKLSGGALLLLIAVSLVFPGINVMGSDKDEDEHGKSEPFIVPIAVPLVVGPGAIAYVMLQASLCHNAAERVAGMAGIVLAGVVTGVLFICAERFISRMGHKTSLILERLMGILLVVLAIQMCLDGVQSFVENLR